VPIHKRIRRHTRAAWCREITRSLSIFRQAGMGNPFFRAAADSESMLRTQIQGVCLG
jgi:hypothetical protein